MECATLSGDMEACAANVGICVTLSESQVCYDASEHAPCEQLSVQDCLNSGCALLNNATADVQCTYADMSQLNDTAPACHDFLTEENCPAYCRFEQGTLLGLCLETDQELPCLAYTPNTCPNTSCTVDLGLCMPLLSGGTNATSTSKVTLPQPTTASMTAVPTASSSPTVPPTGGPVSVASPGTTEMVSDNGLDSPSDSVPPTFYRCRGLCAEVLLTILVEDENDNEPAFVTTDVVVALSEAAEVGTNVTKLLVSDSDSGENARTFFRFSSQQTTFAIGSESGVITLQRALDFESAGTRQYVLAVDISEDALFSTGAVDSTTVTIAVQDENDNAPVFKNVLGDGTYLFDVNEGVPIGTAVGTVLADDADDGVNKLVSYLLSSVRVLDSDGAVIAVGTPPVAGAIAVPAVDSTALLSSFTINAVSGAVTTAASLDYETAAAFELTVDAVDAGQPLQRARTTALVNVRNLNDNPPVFGNASYAVSVEERVGLAGVVVTSLALVVSATDADGDRVVFGLAPSPFAQYVQVLSSGEVYVTASFDFESLQQFTVTLEATDVTGAAEAEGSSSDVSSTFFTTQVQLTISVINVNDREPVFADAPYAASVPESSVMGTVVVTVSATDADSADSDIRYSLDDRGLSPFDIDAVTGDIVVAGALDRETDALYSLVVTAEDSGGLAGAATVTITVTDVNDNAPHLVLSQTSTSATSIDVSVSENVALGTEVLVLSASDEDEGENASISFHLDSVKSSVTLNSQAASSTASVGVTELISLNEASGAITVVGPLDREQIVSLTLVVYAQDAGSPSARRSPDGTVRIAVLDENDNAPIFTSSPTVGAVYDADEGRYFITVSEGAAVGSQLLQLSATDADIGANAVLAFKLVQSTSTTGAVRVTLDGSVELLSTLDREVQDAFEVEVECTDGGSVRQLSSRAMVSILLGDVNDRQPVFTAASLADLVLVENNAAGEVVRTVVATDGDAGNNGDLVYALVRADGTLSAVSGPFTIDSVTGEIFAASIDFEEMQAMQLQLHVADKGQPSLFSRGAIAVVIQDTNDNDPVVTSTFSSSSSPLLRVSEAMAVSGAPLLGFSTSDADGTLLNSDISFTVRAGLVITADDSSATTVIEQAESSSGVLSTSLIELSLDNGATGIVAQGMQGVVVARRLRFSASAPSNTYRIQIAARNPRALEQGVVEGTVSVDVEVLPFLDQPTPVDASAVVFNLDMPDPCIDYPGSRYCSDRQLGPGTSPRFEVWVRRDFDCTEAACAGMEMLSAGTECTCRVFGKGLSDYSADVVAYKLTNLRAGTSYEFQLRGYASDDSLFSVSDFYPLSTTLFAPTDIKLTRQAVSGLYNVSWAAPKQPNGNLIGYRACYCSVDIVEPSSCACDMSGAVQVPPGSTTRTWVLAPDDNTVLPVDDEFVFVVEALSRLADGSVAVVRTEPISTRDASDGTDDAGDGGATSDGSSTASLGTGLVVGIILAAVLVALLVFVVFAQGRRQSKRMGITELERLYADLETGSSAQQKQKEAANVPMQRMPAREGGSPGGRASAGLFVDSGSLFIDTPGTSRAEAEQPFHETSFMGSKQSSQALTSATAEQDDGFWDYYVKERAEQFLAGTNERAELVSPEARSSGSTMNPWGGPETARVGHRQSLLLDGALLPGESAADQSVVATAAAARQNQPDFGLRTPRVMGRGYGGQQQVSGGVGVVGSSHSDGGGSSANSANATSVSGTLSLAPTTAPGVALSGDDGVTERLAQAEQKSVIRRQAGRAFRGDVASATVIEARDMELRIRELKQKGAIDVEFERICQESAREESAVVTEAGELTYNVRKNRYGNVLPRDDTRVLLRGSQQLGSDYINANHVPSFRRLNAFIVSQGPVPTAIADFWRMVWEQRSGVIVMLTREEEHGKRKCHRYWPAQPMPPAEATSSGTDSSGASRSTTDVECEISAGDLRVVYQRREIVHSDGTVVRAYGAEGEVLESAGQSNTPEGTYEIRTFTICKLGVSDGGSEGREVQQYVLKSWPDHGVPASPTELVQFVLDVRRGIEARRASGQPGPAVVHCSAGVGRSGVFVALHNCMQQLEARGSVDVYWAVKYMRTFRSKSVQTLAQYRFIYECVLSFFRANVRALLEAGNQRIERQQQQQRNRGSQRGPGPEEHAEVIADHPEYLIKALESI